MIARSALVALFALIFGALPVSAQEKVPVVATFSILADFVKNVGGDRVAVSTLVQPNGDAHVYQPSPADAKKVADAKIVFMNGLGRQFFPRTTFTGNQNRNIVGGHLSDGVKNPLHARARPQQAWDGFRALRRQHFPSLSFQVGHASDLDNESLQKRQVKRLTKDLRCAISDSLNRDSSVKMAGICNDRFSLARLPPRLEDTQALIRTPIH